LQATVPDLMVPFAPILQQGEQPFAMFVDLQNKYARARSCRRFFVLPLDPLREFRPLRSRLFERGPGRRARCLRRPLSGLERRCANIP
jgi:hypothetical protein